MVSDRTECITRVRNLNQMVSSTIYRFIVEHLEIEDSNGNLICQEMRVFREFRCFQIVFCRA